jgi:hypothetical protein
MAVAQTAAETPIMQADRDFNRAVAIVRSWSPVF